MTDEWDGTGGAPPGGPRRTVYCEDALAWLEARPVLEGCSAIASLPDVSEFPSLTLAEWKAWFKRAAGLVVSRVPADGVALFYQTDVKQEGVWVDKGYLVARAAEEAGCELLFHKVVCRRAPGTVTFGRPAYSHLLCFSRGVRADMAKSTADVLPEAGEVTWTRGMGVEACLVACRFILEQTATRTVVDPFCGHGTVLAVANALGLDAVGVELSRKRARKARNLRGEWKEGKLVLAGAGGTGASEDSGAE
ncbi:site-specific DNA-methyltransferase [Myxococcus sp. RHSTA-1-4]|uniref:site-specific DNA-methyltransferase n=1 Tax=Myxococcus sp. RHSTA-1-4 TaxID=2874601 RepID=UPI001CBDA280|nr:site-specific DNA-methyltransferase [Myxococcus sp. RHSTA-1-4]MBZ4417463.1 site-specific DNA-methyltransferase [Myxococcus sp. RHSTA-1-4]